MGPVDFLVAEYPEGRLTGEAFPYLMHLVDTGTIHILDLAFVAKDHAGMVRQLGLAELPEYAQVIWTCSKVPRRACWVRRMSRVSVSS